MRKLIFKFSVVLLLSQLFLSLHLPVSIAAGDGPLETAPLPNDSFQPAIDGDKVVYLNGTNSPTLARYANVYLKTIGGGAPQKISTVNNKAHAPAIAGGRVVWEDLRNDGPGPETDNSDLYGYSLTTGSETIDIHAAAQLNPDTSGGRFVWADNRNGDWDIYLKNTNGSVSRITTNNADQTEPRIDGDLIVWTDGRHGNHDIYLYNIATATETRITTNGANQNGPDISGKKIVWTDWRSTRNIYVYDLDSPVANGTAVDPRAYVQHSARISGNRVVWTDWRNEAQNPGYNSDIYSKNLLTSALTRVTTNIWQQNSPDVSGNRIVWADWRDGLWRIYLYEFSPSPAPTGTVTINSGSAYTNLTTVTLTLTTSGASQMKFSADNENWTDWEPYSSSKSYLLAAGDGTKTVYVKLKNAEGLESTTVISDSIILDTAAPTDPAITGSVPVKNVWSNDNTIEVNWSGAADGSGSGVDGFSIEWSGSPGTLPDTVKDLEETALSATSPAQPNGDRYFHLRTVDNAGNWTSTVHWGPFQIDTAAPTNPTSVTEIGGAGSGVWQRNVSDPNFTWSGAADTGGSGVKGYYYYWGTNASGSPATFTSSAAFNPTAVATGTYYLRVKTEDNAGNQSAPTTLFTFKYDDEPPVNPPAPAIEAQKVEDNQWQSGVADPDFTWDPGSDAHSGLVGGLAGYMYYWGTEPDGNPTTLTVTPGFDPGPVPSGSTYYLRVKTRDFLGNESAAVRLFTFKYDNTVPTNPTSATETVGGVASDAWQKNVNNPAFVWPEGLPGEGAGIDGYYYYWGPDPDGTSVINYTNERAYDPEPVVNPSINYLRVQAESTAGTVAAKWATLFVFKYDGQAPVDPAITSAQPAANVWTADKTIDVAFSSATDGAGSGLDGFSVSWTQNAPGLPAAVVNAPEGAVSATSPPLSDGIWYFNLRTKDKVGNWTSTVHAGPFKIDTVAPSAKVLAPAISTSVSKTAKFVLSWSGADAAPSSGLASYDVQYKIGAGGAWANWKAGTAAASAAFTGKPGKTYYFRARAKDAAGNTGVWSGQAKTIVPFDQNSLIVKRVGFDGTLKKAASDHYRGTIRYSKSRGDEIRYKAMGNYFALITDKGKGRGKAAIYVDGKLRKTIDTFAKSIKYRQVVYSISFPKVGKHTIRIVNKGTAGRPRINLDGLAVGN